MRTWMRRFGVPVCDSKNLILHSAAPLIVVSLKPFYKFRLSTNNKLRQTLDPGPYLIVVIFRKSLMLLIVYNIILDYSRLYYLINYNIFYPVK